MTAVAAGGGQGVGQGTHESMGPDVLRTLWRRAPLWRFAVCACALLSLLCICFPPRVAVAPPPAPQPNIDTAT